MPTKHANTLNRITGNLTKRKIWWLKIHGSPYQRTGVPDLLVIRDGIACFMEVKVDANDPPSKIQAYRLSHIEQAAGARTKVVYSWEDVREFLQIC